MKIRSYNWDNIAEKTQRKVPSDFRLPFVSVGRISLDRTSIFSTEMAFGDTMEEYYVF